MTKVIHWLPAASVVKVVEQLPLLPSAEFEEIQRKNL